MNVGKTNTTAHSKGVPWFPPVVLAARAPTYLPGLPPPFVFDDPGTIPDNRQPRCVRPPSRASTSWLSPAPMAGRPPCRRTRSPVGFAGPGPKGALHNRGSFPAGHRPKGEALPASQGYPPEPHPPLGSGRPAGEGSRCEAARSGPDSPGDVGPGGRGILPANPDWAPNQLSDVPGLTN